MSNNCIIYRRTKDQLRLITNYRAEGRSSLKLNAQSNFIFTPISFLYHLSGWYVNNGKMIIDNSLFCKAHSFLVCLLVF